MFGSQKITYVASTAVPIIEKIPNTLKDSVFTSVYQSRNIPLGMIDDLVNGINLGMRRFIRYGSQNYVYGSPNVFFEFESFDPTAVIQVLEGIEGKPITLIGLDLTTDRVASNLSEHLYTQLGMRQGGHFINNPSDLALVVTETIDTLLLGNATRMQEIKQGLDSYWEEVTEIYEDQLSDPDDPESEMVSVLVGTTTTTETINHSLEILSIVFTEEEIITSKFISVVDNTPDYEPNLGDDTRYYLLRNLTTNHEITYEYQIIFPLITTTYSIHKVTITTISTIYNDDRGDEFDSYIDELWEEITDEQSAEFEGTRTYELIKPFITGGESVYQALYVVIEDEEEVIKYWVYNLKSNLYSSLNFSQTTSIGNQVYPIVRLRYNNQFVYRDENLGSDELITTKKTLEKLGMNLEDVTNALAANESIDDIDHAYIMAGINLHSETKEGKKYLAEFFKYLAEQTPGSKSEFLDWLTNYETLMANTSGDDMYTGPALTGITTNRGMSSFIIRDAGMNVKISFRYIDVETFSGTFKSGAKKNDVDVQDINDIRNYNNNPAGWSRTTSLDLSKRIFKYQVSANEYQIITVVGPIHNNIVHNGKAITTGLKESANEDDNNFWIPLFLPTEKKLNIVERDRLYHESMIMVVNSYEVVKVKWYQTSFFAFLVMAVGFYFGVPFLSETLGAIAGAATVAAVVAIITPIIFKAIVINLVMKLAVKVLGEDIAMIIAVAAMLLGMGKIDSIKGFEIPFADKFLMLGSNLMQAVSASINAEIAEIGNAMNEFSADAKSKMDELDTLNKEINKLTEIDPMVFVGLQPLIINGESSTEFVNRVLNSTNSGELSIEAVRKFTDIMLQLPEFKDLAEEIEV